MTRVTSSTGNSAAATSASIAAQIAALQGKLAGVQKQIAQAAQSNGGKDAIKQVQMLSQQATALQAQIAMLQQQMQLGQLVSQLKTSSAAAPGSQPSDGKTQASSTDTGRAVGGRLDTFA